MTAVTDTFAAMSDLPQLVPAKARWGRWLSQGLSLLMLVVLLMQLGYTDPAEWRAAMPTNLLFVPVLLMLYLALPVADWIIFNRLWNLPLAGFPIILGKRISNEMLLNYSGEAYFYLWARRRIGLTTAPFGAIKDVNIVSALAGNFLAIMLLPLAQPLISQIDGGKYATAMLASLAAMLAISVVAMLLGRRLFTLPRAVLLWVGGVHLIRLVAGVLLCALLWYLAMPTVPIGFWLALSGLRLLVGRLPLVPNKELLFAVIAVMLVGNEQHVGTLTAMTSMAMLLLHIAFGSAIALGTLFGTSRHLGEPQS